MAQMDKANMIPKHPSSFLILFLCWKKEKEKMNLIYTISTSQFQIIQKSTWICKSHNPCLAIKKITENHLALRWKKWRHLDFGLLVKSSRIHIFILLAPNVSKAQNPKSILPLKPSWNGPTDRKRPKSTLFIYLLL